MIEDRKIRKRGEEDHASNTRIKNKEGLLER